MLEKFLLYSPILIIFACSLDKDIIEYPHDFPPPQIEPERNPSTKAGIELGKQLFFDPLLSKNNNISCSSCHRPELFFTDGVELSNAGNSKTLLKRHAPALFNLAWSEFFFWDGGANDLESQAFQPLTHGDEMANDLNVLVKKLVEDPKYLTRFENAFGIDSISSAYVVRALAQFQRTIISSNSKYDQVMNNQNGFSEIEKKGFEIFKKECAICHTPPLFTDNGFHNNGLDSAYSWEEDGIYLGRFRISHNEEDIGKFKTPSLRNVALTAPYMHDGRLSILNDVIDHYRKGIKYSETLDKHLVKENGNFIDITDMEKEALLSFLKTLTDQEFVKHYTLN